ncbi:hypothetical protein LCGC14_2803890, partial [marine sediment metagenome]
MSEIEKLRSKEECEQQLAVELAVGAVDTIDSLIGSGHEVACEYACQLLFDDMRQKVADKKELPVKIVQHLLKDRCEIIRLTVIETNWKSLTPEQQEEVICEAERMFSKETDGERKKRHSGYHAIEASVKKMKLIINCLLKEALLAGDEAKSLRYIKILGIDSGLPLSKEALIPALKSLPMVFRLYWAGTNEWSRRQDVILAHPDEPVRMKEIERILKKDTWVSDLNQWRSAIGRAYRGESLKAKILKLWTTDPSESIRSLIAMTTTNVDVLSML